MRLGRELSDDPFGRLRRHRYGDLLEDLTEEPTLLVSTMFGCVSCYLHGRLVLALADKRPPWRGILVPTVKAHHESLRAELPDLVVHPVIGKWLYLPESAPSFEESAAVLVRSARAADARIGVEATLPSRRARVAKPKLKRPTARATRRR